MGNNRWRSGYSGSKKQYRRVKYHYRKRYYHNSADTALSVWEKADRLEAKAFRYMLRRTLNHKRSATYARNVRNRYLNYMSERADYASRHITSKFQRKMNKQPSYLWDDRKKHRRKAGSMHKWQRYRHYKRG